ncbi:MAG TPA: zf-HC2 domain-containing protein [Solirubrobacteraceae bacterium]|jgi:anti-sigma factor RsiW
MSAHVEHVTCQQLVAALTDYLEGVMDAQQRADIERHIVFCRGCATYVEQMRDTIALVGRLAEPDPSTEQSKELLGLFRRWQEERSSPK